MLFRLKKEVANCNEWEVREEQIEGKDCVCLYLHFSHYTRDFVLSPIAAQYIYTKHIDDINKEGKSTTIVDLRDFEVDL